ncbi:glycosyltransferase [Flagellimonas sp. HMM57]|uniref:glycosyltransferase n=1 Tax=unclassified Flagellimonas TaxID=2644544 RepID=UPI0013CF7D9D|nr:MULTISPECIES: glycosyltransferase [unclassified Flagellimonas]UII76121.1 glycosyltransferase [Flagellimonas sp. HMM57]
MTSKKKVLFLHPDLRGGGAEKVLVNLLNTLSREKYELTLLSIFDEGVNKELLKNDIKYLSILNKVFTGWSILQKIFSQKFLFRKCVQQEYDVIIAYLEGVPTRVIGGCANPATKLISWVHVDLTDFDISKVYRSQNEMQRTYQKMDAVVGVSEKAMLSIANLVKIPKEKLHVIHNVVDTDLILKQGKEPVTDISFSKDAINLCSVGRLTQQKGYKRLINAMAMLVKENIPVHLYLLGQGELEEDIKRQINELGLQDIITLLGFHKNPHKYVQKCDVFVCSSYQEGFSTAVTESVLLGTPVLTTDCAGMNEILEDGTVGMIVENSETGLNAGLKKLLNDKQLLNTYKKRTEKKSLQFQQKDNTKAVEELIDNLLNQ